MKKATIYVVFLLMALQMMGQCMLYEVPLTDKLAIADKIISAKVTYKHSYWDNNHHRIYTEYLLMPYTDFKQGNTSTHYSLIVEGGQVEDEAQVVYPSVSLGIGDVGLFFLTEQKTIAENSPNYQLAADVQGFIRYDIYTHTAIDAFQSYEINQLERIVEDYTHTKKEIIPLHLPKHTATRAPSITSFSPTTVTAGTGATLTINGTGFGTATGNQKVQVRDPDYSSTQYSDVPAADVVSWTDNQIIINLKGGNNAAGTGLIKVFDANGASTTSNTTLTVTYHKVTGDLGNKDGNGGYKFRTNTEMSSAAVEAFKRALETWRCEAGVNFEYVGTTTIDTNMAGDGNIIRFGVLPTGVLGRCYFTYSLCTNYNPKIDIDIVFKDPSMQTWNYGPNAPNAGQSDFESVALHELGHGLGLGHVSNPANTMLPSLTSGTQMRTPNPTGDVLGADYAMNIATNATTCAGITKMIALTAANCNVVGVGVNEPSLPSTFQLIPNPTSGVVNVIVPESWKEKINIVIYNAVGQKVFSTNSLSLELNHLPVGLYYVAMGETSQKLLIAR